MQPVHHTSQTTPLALECSDEDCETKKVKLKKMKSDPSTDSTIKALEPSPGSEPLPLQHITGVTTDNSSSNSNTLFSKLAKPFPRGDSKSSSADLSPPNSSEKSPQKSTPIGFFKKTPPQEKERKTPKSKTQFFADELIQMLVKQLKSGNLKAFSSEVQLVRQQADKDQLGPHFELALGEIIGNDGTLELLEEYFSSSTYSKSLLKGL